LREARIAAIRIGALAGAAAVDTVAALVAGARVPVVYDPVFGATAGGRFADDATVAAIRTRLLPAVAICTPNLAEAGELAERAVSENEDEMLAVARALRTLGCGAALVTGGHLRGDPVDVLADAAGDERYRGARLGTSMRGTGCVLSASLAAELARGVSLRAAVETARAFVRAKIAGAFRAGDFFIADDLA
jgi:hydroxymethylpyrimidine/phosphomethylpyrimidine kinase